MSWTEIFFLALEMIGTISFALSGAMTAIRKRTDFFGVLFLGVLTAVGGGIFRDLLLGKTPPTAFTDRKYVLLALAASTILFFSAYSHRELYRRGEHWLDVVNNIFDAAGLGIFAADGVQSAWSAGQGDNLFLCLFLGLSTAVGGGLARDLLVQEMPFVLKKRIYAVAALTGSFSDWLLSHRGHPTLGAAVSILLVFTIRMFATHCHWDLPRALE